MIFNAMIVNNRKGLQIKMIRNGAMRNMFVQFTERPFVIDNILVFQIGMIKELFKCLNHKHIFLLHFLFFRV